MQCPCANARRSDGRIPGAEPEWVFPSPRGYPWNEHNLERAWLRLRCKALAAGVRPLKLHCTRHSFVTRALEAGTPAIRVAEWVGASVAVLERHYAHAIPDAEDALAFLDSPGQDRDEPGRGVAKLVTQAGFEPATPSFGG